MRGRVAADSVAKDDDPNHRRTTARREESGRRNFAGRGSGNTTGFDPWPAPAGGRALQPGASGDFPGLGTTGRIGADSERIPDEDQAASRLGSAVPARLLELREERLSGAGRRKASDGTGLAL